MRRALPFLALLVLPLSACQWFQPAQPPTTQTSSSSEDISSQSSSLSSEVPQSVSYTGTVEKAGVSIYQEGTHRLVLDDGEWVLLESSVVPLEQDEGKRVTLQGMERSTVEAGARIVNVTSIVVAEGGSSSSEVATLSSANAESVMVQSSSRKSVAAASSVTQTPLSSSAAVSSLASAPLPASSSSADAPSGAPSSANPLQARIDAMAAYKTDAASWTQQYCSSHIGFCIPVPKNAWYQSFGATAATLWHVELSSEEIKVFGDGPVAVNLVSGTVESAGGADGQIVASGDNVVGYKAWTENRHFQVIAPAKLRAIVERILSGITAAS